MYNLLQFVVTLVALTLCLSDQVHETLYLSKTDQMKESCSSTYHPVNVPLTFPIGLVNTHVHGN